MRTVWAAMAAAALGLAPLAAFSAPPPAGVLVEASAFPNPFDSRRVNARVRWSLSADAPVEVAVHTVFGARVWRRTFAAGAAGGQAGVNEVAWDGTAEDGRKLGKGLYLLVLRAAGERRVVKVGVRH
jgi:hypothetical protein